MGKQNVQAEKVYWLIPPDARATFADLGAFKSANIVLGNFKTKYSSVSKPRRKPTRLRI